MLTNEITPAERAMLEFIRNAEANTIFKAMLDTLSVALCGSGEPGAPEESGATKRVVEAWYWQVEMLGYLHDISLAQQA